MRKKSKIKVSAPGKIILTGEHAVVYGHPAILAAVDRRLVIEGWKTNSQIKTRILESTIPVGVGMGSSAALSVAMAAAKNRLGGKPWDLNIINSMAYEMEKKYHRNPSGGDNTVVTYGGFLWYRKETENFRIFRQIVSATRLSNLFLVNSGTPKETTGEMVSRVADFYARNPKKVFRLLTGMEKIARRFLQSLTAGNNEWKELIGENENYLESLGVVSELGKIIIRKIEKIGGRAKISGGGGKSGPSGIILVYHPDEEKLKNFCAINNLDVFCVKLGDTGVRIEKSS